MLVKNENLYDLKPQMPNPQNSGRKMKHVLTWSYIMLRATPLPADKVIV